MPKILQTDASLWKEKKTLSFSGTYSKYYDTVWTGRLSDGSWPTFLISDTDSGDSRLVLSTRKTVKRSNVLHLPSIHETFAHLPPWDGTTQHAVTLLADLLCYRVIKEEGSNGSPLWLITQTWNPTNTKRAAEIQMCLERNSENPLIDKIILLNETPQKVTNIPNKKVEERIIGKRLTYADVMREILTFPPEVIVVFANADIFLDATWKDLWALNLENVCLALRRYDLPASGDMENSEFTQSPSTACIADSQDTWVVRAEDIQKHANPTDGLDFPFGKLGCDNVFALRMLQKKFLVVNPARSLITWHVHASNVRTYSSEAVSSPIYHYVHPTGLNERLPLLKMPTTKETLQYSVRGPDAAGWLHRLSKKGISRMLGTHSVTCSVPEIFTVKKCFQTMSGLAFDASTMYIGSSPGAQERWSQDSLYPMLPTQQYDIGLVAPLPSEEYFSYFAKLLLLKETCPKENPVYVCPPPMQPLAAVFGLTNTVYAEDKYFVYKEAHCLPVSSTCKVEIAALRRAVTWLPEVRLFSGYRSIVLMEDAGLSYEIPLRQGWDVKVVNADMPAEKIIATFSGAWAVVCTSRPTSHAGNWLLPKGAYVFEISSTSTQAHDLSTVSDLQHIFTSTDTLLTAIAQESK